jgi:hypothetical protein
MKIQYVLIAFILTGIMSSCGYSSYSDYKNQNLIGDWQIGGHLNANFNTQSLLTIYEDSTLKHAGPLKVANNRILITFQEDYINYFIDKYSMVLYEANPSGVFNIEGYRGTPIGKFESKSVWDSYRYSDGRIRTEYITSEWELGNRSMTAIYNLNENIYNYNIGSMFLSGNFWINGSTNNFLDITTQSIRPVFGNRIRKKYVVISRDIYYTCNEGDCQYFYRVKR